MEVDRLVKSGVLVVVSAGNTGRGVVNVDDVLKPTYLEGSINDPGNAQCAITVGSTHKEMPYTYLEDLSLTVRPHQLESRMRE